MMEKILSKKLNLFLIVFLISIVIRVPFLGLESINPDAVNWHYRCQQFANGIKYFQLEKTYPHYHPGVVLCYTMSIPTEIYKQITNEVYDIKTFINFNVLNTYSVVILVSVLIGIAGVLIGGQRGFLFSVLLNLEPFLYGNSRIIHLDSILSLLLFISFLLLFRFFVDGKSIYLYLSSFVLSLAFLTKSVGIVFFVISFLSIFIFSKKEVFKKAFQFFFIFFLSIYIMFPAMWLKPIETFSLIFKEADRVGVRTGHNQLFLGEFYDDEENPGLLFYPVVFFVKTSPLILIGLFLITVLVFKRIYQELKSKKVSVNSFLNFIENHKENIFLGVFYLAYVLIIFYSSKKVDRYILVLIPPIIYFLTSFYRSSYFKKLFLILIVLNIISFVKFFPNLFLYYTPLLGSYDAVNKFVGQKTFGSSIFQLKDHLIKNYGEKNLGFYDIKPMETVYPNSKVFDIRETSSSRIDLVILSLNESLPSKYQDRFVKSETFYFADIPLYEIYIKK